MAQYNNRSEGKGGAILGRPRQAQPSSGSVAPVPPPSKVSRPSAPPASKVSSPPPSKVQKPVRPSLSFHSSFEDEATRVYLGRSSEAPAVVPQDEFAVITAHTATDVPVLPLPQRSTTLPKVAQNPFTTRPALPTYPTTPTMDSCSPVEFPESTQSAASVSVPAAPTKKMIFVGGGFGVVAAAALVITLASSSNGTKSTHVRAAAAKAPPAVQAIALDAPPVALVAPVVQEQQPQVESAPVQASLESESKVSHGAARSLHASRASAPVSHPAPAPVAAVRAEPPPAKVTKVEKHAPQLPVAPMDDDAPKSKLTKAEKDAMARAKATAAEAQAASDNSL